MQSQAPSYSFLPKESFCKDSISIIAYTVAFINFRFAVVANSTAHFHITYGKRAALFLFCIYTLALDNQSICLSVRIRRIIDDFLVAIAGFDYVFGIADYLAQLGNARVDGIVERLALLFLQQGFRVSPRPYRR